MIITFSFRCINEVIRELPLNYPIGAIAARLTGISLRIWHGHVLIKPAVKRKPTGFHQDELYWQHTNQGNELSIWVALVDVSVERGCMAFIPASHLHRDLGPCIRVIL